MDEVDEATAEADAKALMDQWGVGRQGIDDGLVLLVDLDTSGRHGQVRFFGGSGFLERYADVDALQGIADESFLPYAKDGDFDTALLATTARLAETTIAATTGSGTDKPDAPAIQPGPPFPEPERDRAVYDFAGIFTPDTIAKTEATIDAIEQRTGAEVVVYSQPVDYGVTTEETEARARALIDQWGIGRAGFDDGMVLFFDIDPSGQHGQVQLYGAPGFEATYLSNSDRQAIFENDMLPSLRSGDFDGALTAAMTKIDAAATPENAARLQTGRQVNAAIGLVGAPIAFLGLAGWAFFSWRRFGKDPVYLDDPSVLAAAPPPELTAASGAFVMDGGSSRRALTTAMLDLASRGLLSFREDKGLLGLSDKVGVDVDPPSGDAEEEARRRLNARRPTGPAEAVALRAAPDAVVGQRRGLHRARRAAEVRGQRQPVRRGARGARRRPRLVPGQAVEGHRSLDGQGAPGHRHRRGRARARTQPARVRAGPDRRRGDRRWRGRDRASGGSCRRSRWPAR